MALSNPNALLRGLSAGRGATGFGGLKRGQAPAPAPDAAAEPSQPQAVAGAGEGGSEPVEAHLEPSTPEPAAHPTSAAPEPPATPHSPAPSTPQAPLGGVSAAGSATAPRHTPGEVASVLSKLLGGKNLPEGGRSRAVPISFDSQLADYLVDRVLAEQAKGSKVTQAALIREALRTPLSPQIALNGKAILAERHAQFVPTKSSVEVPESNYAELEVERTRFANRENRLTIPALIELRVLCWAVQQADWTF